MTELGTPLIPVAKLVWRKHASKINEEHGSN